MATFSMNDVLALMPQAEVAVTIDGAVFTVPAMTPFTTSSFNIEVAAGTVFAVMYNTTNTHGDTLQVFSIDEIVTVA